MNITREQFEKLAKKHLTALQGYDIDETIEIFGVGKLYDEIVESENTDINTQKVTRVEEYLEYLKSIEQIITRESIGHIPFKKPEYPPTGIMKPLDIVRTPAGSIGIVTETNRKGTKASIDFINGCNKALDHNAWWEEGDGLE